MLTIVFTLILFVCRYRFYPGLETDKIILHYSIATESEDSINSHLINSIDYVSYLEWVEKIHLSINFFANKERTANFDGGEDIMGSRRRRPPAWEDTQVTSRST